MLLEVCILNSEKVIFEGKAKSLILPGEEGVFEILPFHKDIISRLIAGNLILNNQKVYPIRRGVVKVEKNKATVLVEE